LAWRRSLCGGWCAATLASVRARPSVQRVGCPSARAYVGHERCLWRLGLLVSSLGWALAFRSGVGVLLTALLIPPLIARIGAEETLLRTQFGGEYVAYRGRTWRLIPGIFTRVATDESQVLEAESKSCLRSDPHLTLSVTVMSPVYNRSTQHARTCLFFESRFEPYRLEFDPLEGTDDQHGHS
jgi:hypothetical protein